MNPDLTKGSQRGSTHPNDSLNQHLDPHALRRKRWRLILEGGTEEILQDPQDPVWDQRSQVLTFLYEREHKSRNVRQTPAPPTKLADFQPSGSSQPGSTQPQTGTPATTGSSSQAGSDPSQFPSQQQDPNSASRDQSQASGGASGPGEFGKAAAKGFDRSESSLGKPEGSQDSQPSQESQGSSKRVAQGSQGTLGKEQAQAGDPQAQKQSGTQSAPGSEGQGSSEESLEGSSPNSTPGQPSSRGDAETGIEGSDPGSPSPSDPHADEADPGDAHRSPLTRWGGLGPSQLTVPDWINAVHELFPRKAIERLERDALERYHLEEIVTNPNLFSRAEPSPTLLKAVLRTKHLMNPEVLSMARQLVQKVVNQLMEELARDIRSSFTGALGRRQRSPLKIAKNFDPITTIRRNLSSYDPETQRLYIKTPYFFSQIRRQIDCWKIIILVDESGSMLDSVIYAAVTAAIFFGLKQIHPHLCLFDTSVVDVTDHCSDPVETIMQLQLGGGTDIGQAVAYGATLVTNPSQTLLILISDFFEGRGLEEDILCAEIKQLVESGVQVLGLAALDSQARPDYNRCLAQRLVDLGASVGAMTPWELAKWVAEKVR